MKYKSLLLLMLILVASGFAQSTGTIDCTPGETIPAWEKPNSIVVVRQLSCGRIVGILGMESGYIRIQISEDMIGYVKPQYVRALQTQSNTNDRIAELEKQIKALEQQSARPISQEPAGQPKEIASLETPRQVSSAQGRITERTPNYAPPSQSSYESGSPSHFDVGGIFTWVRSFGSGFHADYFGWNVALNGNINERFGLEANIFGNYYNSPTSLVGESHHGLAGGPRISFPTERVTPFVHFLVGFAHAKVDVLGIDFSAGNNLVLMPGFGLDININRRFAIRAFQADYPVLRGGGQWAYKTLRIGGGLVTKF